jgi:hypothetical protein
MNNQSPTYRQLQLPIVTGVASKLEAILQRCGDRVKTGSIYFDQAGEAHARHVAQRDQPQESCGSRNQ